MKLLKKNKILGAAAAICFIIMSSGVAWAIANADSFVVESSIFKIELSKNKEDISPLP